MNFTDKNYSLYSVALFLILLMSSNLSFSQETKKIHEVKLIYSDALPLTIGHALVESFSDALNNAFSNYKSKRENESTSGMWGVGYRYQVSPRISVGIDFGYMHMNSDIKFNEKNTGDIKLINRKTNYIALLPTAQFTYMERSKVQLYGSLGAGALFTNATEKGEGTDLKNSRTDFAFQINPIAIRVGKQIAGFAELGFGYKGFLNIGASMRF